MGRGGWFEALSLAGYALTSIWFANAPLPHHREPLPLILDAVLMGRGRCVLVIALTAGDRHTASNVRFSRICGM